MGNSFEAPLQALPYILYSVPRQTNQALCGPARNVTNFGAAPACVKVLVLWATGKMLINRLPDLSLITLSSPLSEQQGPWTPNGAGRALSDVLNNLWGPRKRVKFLT